MRQKSKIFRFHDLRHSFASHLVLSGVDLIAVKDPLGHAGINMTVRYSHLVPEHKAQAVAKLEERYKPAKEESQAESAVVSPKLKEAISAQISLQSWHKTGTFFGVKRSRARNRE